MGAVLAILMPRNRGTVGYLVAGFSHDVFFVHAVGNAIGAIGGDDAVVFID